jgi:hypothetical protein
MNTRKYISEFGLNMCTAYRLLLQQDQLHKVGELEFDPHIYIIGRRPRITIDPVSIKITEQRVTGQFFKQQKSQFIPIPFDVQNFLGTAKLQFQSEYPFTEFAFIDESGSGGPKELDRERGVLSEALRGSRYAASSWGSRAK